MQISDVLIDSFSWKVRHQMLLWKGRTLYLFNINSFSLLWLWLPLRYKTLPRLSSRIFRRRRMFKLIPIFWCFCRPIISTTANFERITILNCTFWLHFALILTFLSHFRANRSTLIHMRFYSKRNLKAHL